MDNKHVDVIGLGEMGLGIARSLSPSAHPILMQGSTAGLGRENGSAVINIFPGIPLPAAND
ncbi:MULTISPECIES: hypothetical protein [unclassified Pseudomonas]|uniref:hypothetical protein n=1 Tax=unclassified Pseudomonas TaxID=196821 RepID=UPI0025D2B7FE|nr:MULTISPECIES: hypothetical protein [unclassified Pseudomonas]